MDMSKKHGVAAGIVKSGLWIYCSFAVFILAYMLYNSFRPKKEMLTNTLGVPKEFTFRNFEKLLVNDHFLRFFMNSVIILAASLVLIVLISSLTSYGIARYRFKLRKAMRIYFLIGLMFPVQLGIVPIFLLMSKMNLVNNMLSVIIVSAAGISMPVFMLSNFFSRLPEEIHEAAIIDGAGEWTTFYKIMFPMASPVVIAISITVSVQIWNQFFLPLIFLQSEKYKTVPLIVMKYTKNLFTTLDSAMAVSVLSTIPILILFVIFSNKIIDGVTAGAVKG